MTESPEPDPLAFTPVPSTSTRHDGWTPERQYRFIRALAATGAVAAAARAVGKSATAAYKLRERVGATGFVRAWTVAQQMAHDRAFEHAMQRSLDGYDAPRFYRGRQVGTVRKFDYRLMTAALRAPTPRDTAPLSPAEQAQVAWLLSDGSMPPPGVE